ncbi:ABC transporter ATP-binding protein [Paracoccus laeviglucosivorans]|uniref:Iron complex transport system ATP-binding protein n=1 Tax=Paracoccus laeviglucosivorans TaxID=1197861 RepID=A0A521CAB3_9RHOB|nr:ABC transporter ATP-binding protein [Paracoccus laeviglucosivorans]SMO56353.1 iron complex transport system ATP-binding protein [Paracoccus laeviglucosivorans]
MKLRAENLSLTAQGRAILDGVSLDIPTGVSFGLIGPNGSGKSTLLRLLAGLEPRAQGHVMLDDTRLRDLPRREIARRIALVEQQADTGDALSAREVVELGRTPWLAALQPFGPEDHHIVDQTLAAVGMTELAARHWSTLSGGERQRLQIARALAQRPQVLLLDEPTNHLDIHHQLALLRLVSRLQVTVVMALHDLNQALECDLLGVMSGGRLIACGPPATVLTPERLRQIFRIRSTSLRDPSDDAQILRFHCLEDER